MSLAEDKIQNISYWKERVDLAAAFRWAARYKIFNESQSSTFLSHQSL